MTSSPMTPHRFAKAEAERYVGRTVRSLVVISTHPEGSTGRVVDLQEVLPEEFDLVLEWDLPCSSQPLRDWFSRDDYNRDLVEV
jgi:hypothetical protein